MPGPECLQSGRTAAFPGGDEGKQNWRDLLADELEVQPGLSCEAPTSGELPYPVEENWDSEVEEAGTDEAVDEVEE